MNRYLQTSYRPRGPLRSRDELVMHLQVNGVTLEYAEMGTGVPVVFSHGGYSDLRYWEPQREAFAERYRYIAYSRRFHGSGTWPP